MAFGTIYKAAMHKKADVPKNFGYEMVDGRMLPTAAPGTSYTPVNTQLTQNLGDFFRTVARDAIGGFVHSTADKLLPGDAKQIAKNIWYKDHTESPVDYAYNEAAKRMRAPVKGALNYAHDKGVLPDGWYDTLMSAGRGGLKPSRRITSPVEATRTKKYIDPSTVTALPENYVGSMQQTMDYYKAMQAKDPNWKPKPKKALGTTKMPFSSIMTRMAGDDIRNFTGSMFRGSSTDRVRQMILNDFYKASLASATGMDASKIDDQLQMTPEMLERWIDNIAEWRTQMELSKPEVAQWAGDPAAVNALKADIRAKTKAAFLRYQTEEAMNPSIVAAANNTKAQPNWSLYGQN